MNRASLYSRTLRVLDTNSTAYPQSTFNDDLVEAVAIRTQEILRLKGYKFVTQTHAYTDFVSITGLEEGDNGYNGEYAFPSDLLDLERIEVTFDGTNWYVISKENGKLYNISENYGSEQNQADIQAYFSKSDPMATIVRGSLFIRPLNDGSTQSNGIHLIYSPRQATIDEDTDEPEFESNLHQALIYDCAEMEMMAHPNSYDSVKERRIARKKSEIDNEFEKFYRNRIKHQEEINPTNETFN